MACCPASTQAQQPQQSAAAACSCVSRPPAGRPLRAPPCCPSPPAEPEAAAAPAAGHGVQGARERAVLHEGAQVERQVHQGCAAGCWHVRRMQLGAGDLGAGGGGAAAACGCWRCGSIVRAGGGAAGCWSSQHPSRAPGAQPGRQLGVAPALLRCRLFPHPLRAPALLLLLSAVEDIDAHIAELEHRISHDSLSLNEEKKVLEQIKALKKSRRWGNRWVVWVLVGWCWVLGARVVWVAGRCVQSAGLLVWRCRRWPG